MLEYARICLYRVLNMSHDLNMPEFWVWQGSQNSEYGNMQELQGSKYGWICPNRTWICLNMSEFTGIGRVLSMCHKIDNMYVWEGSEYVLDLKYLTVLNIRKFSLIWRGSVYASGCNCGRLLNIPGFWVPVVCVCKPCTRSWICLNMAELCPMAGFWICLAMLHRVLPPVLNLLGLRIW